MADSARYLFNSLAEFYDSEMWRGSRSYPIPPRVREWFGWVYLAAFNGCKEGEYLKVDDVENLRIKIGMTYDLVRRNNELTRENKKDEGQGDEGRGTENEDTNEDDENNENDKNEEKTGKKVRWSKQIVYAFSVPRPALFELTVKRFLKNFINKDLRNQEGIKVEGASEIVQGLAFEPLVHIIQLCILKTCLVHDFLKSETDENFHLKKYVENTTVFPPDIIKWKNHTYYGRRDGTNSLHTIRIMKGVQETIAKSLQRKKIKKISTGAFDLTGKLKLEDGTSKLAMFIQYVFDRNSETDARLPEKKPFLEDVSRRQYTTDTKEAPPSPYFGVKELAFSHYKNKKDGYFPVEIIGYHNGQYAVRWIDRRRFAIDQKKWVDYDQKTSSKYNNNEKQKKLSDFLMEEIGDAGNINNDGRYRDYIQRTSSTGEQQPTSSLIPSGYEIVDFEYKNQSQLVTWNGVYNGINPPSVHWKTIEQMKENNLKTI